MCKGMFHVNLNNVSMFHLERNLYSPSDRNSILIWLNVRECHSLKSTYPSLGMF